uniref:Uncharacterized protein n=1 Tax=Aegilops tauschii subsp. strangulata TaxID=200361 RepID=A0A453KVR6_AEGTS
MEQLNWEQDEQELSLELTLRMTWAAEAEAEQGGFFLCVYCDRKFSAARRRSAAIRTRTSTSAASRSAGGRSPPARARMGRAARLPRRRTQGRAGTRATATSYRRMGRRGERRRSRPLLRCLLAWRASAAGPHRSTATVPSSTPPTRWTCLSGYDRIR